MPEFILPPKYKQLFNEYDLSVIKADHYVTEREDLRVYRIPSWIALSSVIRIAAGCCPQCWTPFPRLKV